MKKGFLIILAAVVACVLGGCASADESAQGGPGQTTSDIPWNKPQSWEGTGQLGSAMGH